MANIEHSAISDPHIHEPKGIASVSAGRVYVSNGSASGDWLPRSDVYQCRLDDVSSVGITYIPIAFAGTVTRVVTVLGGAINTANATLTVKNSAGSSMGTIVVQQSGSAAGDVDVLNPTVNNTVSNNSFVTVESDGASNGSAPITISVVVERSQ